MMPSRWEHGSEFHWAALEDPQPDPARDALASRALRRYATGRAALAAAVRASGARRLWIPSYFCPEVSEALEREVPLAVYPDLPEPNTAPACPSAQPGDAVLWVNTFAIRQPPSSPVPSGVITIEDHTHDPLSSWAQHSAADYWVASLRKTMPIPDGAVAWSPTGAHLPAEVPPDEAPDLRKLTAMVLKGLYLRGHAVAKDEFRALAIAGETALAECTAMSRLSAELWTRLPLSRWRSVRADNHGTFVRALGVTPGVRVLQGRGPAEPPFSVLLSFDEPAARTRVRAALIAARIYPAILWDLASAPSRAGVTEHDRHRSQILLSLHCDARYGAADMERVAACVRAAIVGP